MYLALCGNGFDDPGEECDDGNVRDNDGCSSSCATETKAVLITAASEEPLVQQPTTQQLNSPPPLVAAASLCGNGILEPPEECDDSNRRSSDGCNDSCLLELGICGDGKLQQLLGEQCEQATHNKDLPYTCINCRFVSASCGDSQLDLGEECDRGNLNSTSPDADCRPDCSLSRCGDSILDSTELCDDGNRRAGDGCDAYCRTETKVLAENDKRQETSAPAQLPTAQQLNNQQLIQFPYAQPQMPYYQPLPFASLQPLIQQAPQTTQSGPAAVAAIGAGAAAGWSWMRRKRK